MSDSEKLESRTAETGNSLDSKHPLSLNSVQGSLHTSSTKSPMPDCSTSPREDWRELAQRVAVENDSNKMVELVQQLIAKIDEERRPPFHPTAQSH